MNNTEFKLNELKPVELADNPRVKDSFVNTLVKIHRMEEPNAEAIYNREALYYKKAIIGSEKLKNCTNISLYSAFLEIAITGLSIQPGGKSEAYLESRGTKQQDGSYINTASLVVTAYGELAMRIRNGQLERMSNPQIIYKEDIFQPRTNERGDLTVDYRPNIPRKSNEIIGCYVCLVLPKDQRDFKWLLQDDIARLMKYSERGMGGKANALYSANSGQIDPGFLEAKTIKHAMRTLPKLRTSENVVIEGDDEPINGMQDFEAHTANPINGEDTGTSPVSQTTQSTSITVEDNEDLF